jgi:UDP-N-acetylmuramate dehydrogenase
MTPTSTLPLSDLAARLSSCFASGGGRALQSAPVPTTMRVGGPAALLIELDDPAALARALPLLGDLPRAVVGLGSNVILPDEGYPGAILRLVGALKQPTWDTQPPPLDLATDTNTDTNTDPNTHYATFGAGVPNAHAVRALHAQQLIGLEHVALVPGTLGGAVAMNAGTKHGEIRSALAAVEVATPDGALRWLSTPDLHMAYRTAHLPPGAVIARVCVRVRSADPTQLAAAQEQVAAEKRYRAATQPFKLATSGSIFRNPPGDHAGRLIEACGLKGFRIGGAVISPLHANWIVNDASALASDVLALISTARTAVSARFSIDLHPEVRVLTL